MNENINLVEILKDCPKGTKFYSSVYGELIYSNMYTDSLDPKIYFIDENSNIKIEKASDDMINGLVKVSVPDNFNGKIVVSYDGTIIQKVAFVISVITLLSTLLSIAYKRIRKIRYE